MEEHYSETTPVLLSESLAGRASFPPQPHWDLLPFEDFSIRLRRVDLPSIVDIIDAVTPEQLTRLQVRTWAVGSSSCFTCTHALSSHLGVWPF